MSDPAPALIQASVLVPVFRRNDGVLRLLLVRRGEQGPHGGQLAFPGGKWEPGDASPEGAALREAREEVGIEAERVTILAPLPSVDTLSTGYLIHPFLARIEPPPRWICQAGEIAEALEVEVRDLARPELRGEEMRQFPAWPAPVRVPYCRVGRQQLWGATYRIVEALVPRLLAGEWTV